MPDDPSVYGSYMNFFLPQSARVGPALPVPGLYDMLGGLGRPDLSKDADTPEAQRKKEQERQKQYASLGQQGLKMMQPVSVGAGSNAPPPDVPVAPQPVQQMPQATQFEPSTPSRAPIPAYVGNYDPRDPRRRNPLAGMPTPFGNFYR